MNSGLLAVFTGRRLTIRAADTETNEGILWICITSWFVYMERSWSFRNDGICFCSLVFLVCWFMSVLLFGWQWKLGHQIRHLLRTVLASTSFLGLKELLKKLWVSFLFLYLLVVSLYFLQESCLGFLFFFFKNNFVLPTFLFLSSSWMRSQTLMGWASLDFKRILWNYLSVLNS